MTLHYLVNLFKTPALDQPFVHFSVFLWRQPHVPFLHLRIHTSGRHQVPTQYFFLVLYLFICLCTCAPGTAWQFHCPKALFRQDEDSALLGPGAAKAPSDRRGTSPNVWFHWLFNAFLRYKCREFKIVHKFFWDPTLWAFMSHMTPTQASTFISAWIPIVLFKGNLRRPDLEK